MTAEPVWIDAAALRIAHAEAVAEFGGPPGVRDDGLLESALARPLNAWSYGETDLAALAGLYAEGIVRNHPFLDGNKRAAFVASMAFLALNATRAAPDQMDAAEQVIALASGSVDADGYAAWLRANA